MQETIKRILLIEDNPADADLIIDELTLPPGGDPGAGASYEVAVQGRLKSGLEHLAVRPVDLVLLDLSLPDCRGLETFLRVFRSHPSVPVVIISGVDDLSLAFDAVRSGAQDYLFKGDLDRSNLMRAVQFALERHARMRRLNPFLARRSTAPVDAADRKASTIQSGDPDLFHTLTDRYRDLVELACKQRLFRMVQNVSGELHGLAMYLSMLQAGPEEVEAMHISALEQLVGQVAPDQATTYVEEAQLLLVELYRYLVSFYRDAAVGVTDVDEPTPEPTEPGPMVN